MRVPFYDPAAEYAALEKPIDAAMRAVLESGVYAMGPNVDALETELATFFGCEHVVGTASGTAALELSFRALGIGPGDEVITAPNSDISTASAITNTGAQVVFADVEPDSLNVAPSQVAAKRTERTRAVVPVHLFGQPADLKGIQEVAGDLLTIEDAALAVGARCDGQSAGTIGDAGCVSMNSRKILSAFGDAGAVLTNRDDVADEVRSLRSYGKEPHAVLKREHRFRHAGFNARIDELQAAVLRVKLKKLPEWLERRRVIAARYDEAFQNLAVQVPVTRDGSRHAYRAYTILVDHRDALAERLAERGVETTVYYAPPLHLQPAYAALGHARGDFPVAERIAETMLSLPIHPTLTDDQVEIVIEAVSTS